MSFDTLYQKITAPAAVQYAAVDLSFIEAGGDVLVALCALDDAGYLSDTLAQQRVERAAIKVDGTATRVTWPAPVLVAAGAQCAIAVSAGDTTTSLQVGQIGEQAIAGGRVTSAQAAIGEMAHISPSGVVTRYTQRIMKFDLLGVAYSEQVKTVTVGTVQVLNATALVVNAGADQPTNDARISYAARLTNTAGELEQEIPLDSGQIVQLSAPHNGAVDVNATIRMGADGLGALLQPGTLLAVGSLLTSGTYITPAFQTGGGTDLRVIFEADIPGGAGVTVDAQLNNAGAWVPVPWESSSSQTAGTIELTHQKTGIVADSLRLRLTLTGNTTARPQVRNLRAAVL